MTETIFVGILGAISTIIAAYIGKFGIPFINNYSKIIKGSGKGADYKLKIELEDFCDDDAYTYTFKECELQINNHTAVLKANMITKDENDNEWHGIINGSGLYRDGVAYITYEGNYLTDKIKWNGLLALRVSTAGSCKGYWITEHTSTNGKFSFGWIRIDR